MRNKTGQKRAASSLQLVQFQTDPQMPKARSVQMIRCLYSSSIHILKKSDGVTFTSALPSHQRSRLAASLFLFPNGQVSHQHNATNKEMDVQGGPTTSELEKVSLKVRQSTRHLIYKASIRQFDIRNHWLLSSIPLRRLGIRCLKLLLRATGRVLHERVSIQNEWQGI